VLTDTQYSNPAKKQENQHNYKDKPYSAGRIISPTSAVWPPGQNTEKCQDQKNNQNCSEHILPQNDLSEFVPAYGQDAVSFETASVSYLKCMELVELSP
jgi:hypothetical protein